MTMSRIEPVQSKFAGKPVPFTEADVVRYFDADTIEQAKFLVENGFVEFIETARRIKARVFEAGHRHEVSVTPLKFGARVAFDRKCDCGGNACAHVAAVALAALEARPEWRRPVQVSLFEEFERNDALPQSSQPRASQLRASQPAASQSRAVSRSATGPSATGAKPPVASPMSTLSRASPAVPPREISPARAAAGGVGAIGLGREERVALWTIEPGDADALLYITARLARVGRDGKPEKDGILAAPKLVIERTARTIPGDADRAVARLLGVGGQIRTPIAKDKKYMVDLVLKHLAQSGRLRWQDGSALQVQEAPSRIIRGVKDPKTGKVRPLGLPEGGTLLRGDSWWCVDPKAGRITKTELQIVAAPPPIPKPVLKPDRPGFGTASPGRPGALKSPLGSGWGESIADTAASIRPSSETAEIVDRSPRIILRIGKVMMPDLGLVDALHLAFDYGDEQSPAEIEPDDQRQFAKVVSPSGKVVFARRDKKVEQAVLDRLTAAGLGQFRRAPESGSASDRGARYHAFRGRDAAERWIAFLKGELAAMEESGCTVLRDAEFGVNVVEPDGDIALGVMDAGDGWFDLDIGIEIDGVRRPLVPILAKLIETGGMDPSRIIDGKIHAVLEDGRALALPAERTARLLSVLESMLESGQQFGDKLRVPLDEADNLLDLDDLEPRAGESQRIAAYLARLRSQEAPLSERAPPSSFLGELRPYQRQGLAWLQRLRANGLSGCLADDMGLGKTAQTIAHIVTEREAGRLEIPALVVVPTSLVPNWSAELARFAPHLKAVVMHGVERHERWEEIDRAQIVVTTYAILVRDALAMQARHWSIVVLDEAQAIKNPESKVTRAACMLQAEQRICLSGTPVENNLEEIWSQFAFLMSGLLGDRKTFQKRYRTPIEKRGDQVRAAQFSRRLRPFLLRRTKADVAADLPPKTEMVCRIELDSAQRDLYEVIRLSMNEKVREAIEAQGLARSRITVLDALLKLRQTCCDPRLVKLPAAQQVTESTKLAALIEAQIGFVELTGATADRATPVRRFQAGEIPVFLISLKAGGRGLNLTAADTVIHYDPWWNPAAEAQATDRAHRIGQDKPVFVYKLIAAGTVEEKILDLQRRKTNLADAAVGGAAIEEALGDEDIQYLLAV
jgi:superfamily II DNA or RNA helicase